MARSGADVEKLRSLADELEKLIKKLGLVGMTNAAEFRGTSRASIFQLVERERLDSEFILGKRYVFIDQLKNFERAKPGPALGTTYNRKSIKRAAKRS